MHIFIDESGSFLRSDKEQYSISCVGALIIPGRKLAEIEDVFKKISSEWPQSKSGEIKRRLLNEEHIATLCEFLASRHVLFEASVMDMNLWEDVDTDHHQSKQAEGMTINLNDDYHPELIASVWNARHVLEKMPRQLYAQAVALTDLASKTCQNGQLYYCQRYPGELARFRWVIDAKNKGQITDYEKWWSSCVMPMIQSRSLREPIIKLRGGDYSAFRRNFPKTRIPSYLQPHTNNSNTNGDDLSAIFRREMEFADSESHIGLQISDVLTNALRRSLSGRLQPDGWKPIRKLMIFRPKGAVGLISLAQGGTVTTPYAEVMEQLNYSERFMIKTEKKS